MTSANNKKIRVLIAEDEANFSLILHKELARRNFEVSVVRDGRSAVEICDQTDFDVVVMDIQMPNLTGMEALKILKTNSPSPEVIMLTGHATLETAIEALKGGAYDYLTKPCKIEELDVLIRKAHEKGYLEKENQQLHARLSRKEGAPAFITRAPKMLELLGFVERVARTDSNVLIIGESGVGKELIAQSLHRFSLRRDGPFIDINCGAIQETLLESEMFGHEKGAFTNADSAKLGLFELADGGSLFLDEIGELSPRLQVKLLRVLETKTFFRVGGTKQVKVDIRLISATNKNLGEEVEQNNFRQDLLYRINTVAIEIPPLRDRSDDVPLLVDHFLKQMAKDRSIEVAPDTQDCLRQYRWPGNVRELRNVIERALVLCARGRLTPDHLPVEISRGKKVVMPLPVASLDQAASNNHATSLADLEKEQIFATLEKVKWHRGKAAQLLGITPKTLYRKLRTYQDAG
jgi:DNA-binding NtrC family response regulator